MTSHHVITFYSIERIENNKKLGRVVERFCIKNKIVGNQQIANLRDLVFSKWDGKF